MAKHSRRPEKQSEGPNIRGKGAQAIVYYRLLHWIGPGPTPVRELDHQFLPRGLRRSWLSVLHLEWVFNVSDSMVGGGEGRVSWRVKIALEFSELPRHGSASSLASI